MCVLCVCVSIDAHLYVLDHVSVCVSCVCVFHSHVNESIHTYVCFHDHLFVCLVDTFMFHVYDTYIHIGHILYMLQIYVSMRMCTHARIHTFLICCSASHIFMCVCSFCACVCVDVYSMHM